MPVNPGETLLHYRIERKLGEGGMGEVWLAHDTKLERPVALKFLGKKAALDPEARERLAREARAASALNHPNILTIYAVESDGEQAFIAMEYADGESLEDWMRGRTPAIDEVLGLGLAIGDGLAAAHEKGIVHRDIKPSNVMVSSQVRVQVMDFGLAKVDSEPQLTQPGSALGTLMYMSPEQVKGQAVDARSDVFSFGAMLYELACGTSPFHREGGPAAILNAILNEDPPVASRVRGDLPEDFDRIVARALEKDRDRRYPSLRAMLDDMRALRDERPIAHAGAPAARKGPWAGVVAVLALLAAAGWWWSRASDESAAVAVADDGERPSPTADPTVGPTAGPAAAPAAESAPPASDPGEGPQTEPEAAAPSGATALEPLPRYDQRLLSLLGGSPHSGVLSPDGTLIAFLDRAGAHEQLFVAGLDRGEPRKLTAADQDVERPRWQPEGNLILFQHRPSGEAWRDGSVYVVSALGSEPRELLSGARNASWSPDGREIVFEREHGIWMADATGENQRRLDGIPLAANPTTGFMPALSPDGEWIVYFVSELGPLGRLFLARLDGSEIRPLSDSPEIARDPLFSPDGKWVIHSSDRGGPRLLWRASTDPSGPYPPQSITTGTGADSEPCVSADGKRVVFTNARREFVVQTWDPIAPDRAPRVLRASRAVILFPSWSPKGERIAAFGEGRRGGSQLLVIESDGSGLEQLTDDLVETSIFPRWSADAEYLYYYHQAQTDRASLRRLSLADGTSQLVADDWGMQTQPFPTPSPDGRKLLAFSAAPGGSPTTVELDFATGEEEDLGVTFFRAAYSETGEWIIGEWPIGEIRLLHRPTGRLSNLGQGQIPRLAPDGSSVYFLVADGEEWKLWTAGLEGEDRRELINLGRAYEGSPWYDVNRYGEIVWSEYRSSPRELWLLEER